MLKFKAMLVVVLVLLCCSDVMAARRWRRSYSRTTTVSRSSGPSNLYVGSDQQRAYAEAKYMYENRIYRHVGATIGLYEGFGVGGPSCATCTPRGSMTLTADAHYGNIRVRAWR